MTLLDEIAATFHKPHRAVCYINGVMVTPLSISTDFGYDMVSARARIVLPSHQVVSIGADWRTLVAIDMGWGPWLVPAFRGFLENDSLAYFPLDNTVEAAGPLKLTQYQYPSDVSYEDMTDGAIVEDLLTRAGVELYSVEDSGLTLGTVEPVILKAGRPPWDLINQIDQVTGYKTFDCPDGVVRRRPVRLPGDAAAFAYEQGNNILSISRRRATSGLHNKVVVTGLTQGSDQASATRQTANTYIPNPPQYVAFDFRSELIETDDVADDVAERLMETENRIKETLSIETAGNPYLYPAITISALAEKLGIDLARRYLLQHFSNNWGADGFISSLTVEGGRGEVGELVEEPAGDPEPAFTMTVTLEGWEESGSPVTYYTVSCDASGSYHPNGDPEALAYSWSNSENADVGTEVTYATKFTEAELATATITLEVEDPDSNTGSITLPVQGNVTPILVRTLWAALGDIAAVSQDGGQSWLEFEAPYADAPAREFTCVAPQGGNGKNWFGAIGSSGQAWGDVAHWLVEIDLSKPESEQMLPVHNFGSPTGKEITAIWKHEVNTDRLIVGMENGEIWATSNLSSGALSTWQLLVTLPARVNALVESFHSLGEIRAAAGESYYITFNGFASYSELVDFTGGEAWAIALSFAGNYVAGELAGSPVMDESGATIALPDPPDPDEIRGLTHHARRPILFAGDRNGVTYARPEGATEFEERGSLPGTPPINQMVRDGEAAEVLYAAANDRLAKSYDQSNTWKDLLTWDTGTFPDRFGYGIGYGGQPVEQTVSGECVTTVNVTREFISAPSGAQEQWYVQPVDPGAGTNTFTRFLDGNWEVTLMSITFDAPPPMDDEPEAFPVVYIHRTGDAPGSWTTLEQFTGVGDSIRVLDEDPGFQPHDIDAWMVRIDTLHSSAWSYTVRVCPVATGEDEVEITSDDTSKAYLVSGSLPSGWRTLGYVEDGSWLAAVELSGTPETLTGGLMVWRDDTTPAPEEEVLFRHTFDPALSSIDSATLYIRANNSARGVWINDRFLRSLPASDEVSGDGDGFVIAIAPDALNPSGDNVLAIHAVNGESTIDDETAWVAWRLSIVGAA